MVVVTLFPSNTVMAVEGKQRAKMTMTMAMIVATLLPLKTVVGEEGKRFHPSPTTERGITPFRGCVPCARWAETNFPAVLN